MQLNKRNFQFFHDTLLTWYEVNGRLFPWRKKNISPYEVWVSEVMLQQTQVSRGKGYYQKFLKRFPKVEMLAKSHWEEFLPYYEGLGYYARGRNMLKTAKELVSRFGGKFPKEKDNLLKFPGVGDYTANAILAFSRDEAVIAWDTNVKRVITRYFYNGRLDSLEKEKVEKYFRETKGVSGRSLNNALMDFGSLLCPSRPKREGHAQRCPFGDKCHCFEGINQLSNLVTKLERGAKNMKVCLYLHKDHKEYYSSTKIKFHPFLLPTGVRTRSEIKNYFLHKFGLKLSVRPPHGVVAIKGKAYTCVNAQILSGKNPFYVHSKSAL